MRKRLLTAFLFAAFTVNVSAMPNLIPPLAGSGGVLAALLALGDFYEDLCDSWGGTYTFRGNGQTWACILGEPT